MKIGLTTAVAAVLILLAAGPAQADTCANAAFRTGAAANLPDCRAWEQVSPADKQGSGVSYISSTAFVGSNDRVYYDAPGLFSGADSVLYDTGYLGTRGSAWSSRGLDPPISPTTSAVIKATLGLSEDGTKAVVISNRALSAGAVNGNVNLYIRDLTQPAAYRLVVTSPDQRLFSQLVGIKAQGAYMGGTADLSAFAFLSPALLTPDATEGPNGTGHVYLWRDGQLTLASKTADGTNVDVRVDGSDTRPRREHRLSDDGRHVTFITNSRQPDPNGNGGFGNELYEYTAGDTGATLLSREEFNNDAPTAVGDRVASSDGQSVVFSSGALLVPGQGGLFRWNSANDQLEDLLAPYGGGSVNQLLGSSPDAQIVWFISYEPIGPDSGTGSFERLYALDLGANALRYVGDISGSSLDALSARLSPDGRTIAFQSQGPIGGIDNQNPDCRFGTTAGLCLNIFTWSADNPSAPIVCASCAPGGARSVGDSTFGRAATFFDGRFSGGVLDDGRVFFDSGNRLSAADTNAAADIYQYAPGGSRTLLSRGTGPNAAYFGGVSDDGNSVLFFTAAGMVPQDNDGLYDVYTARVGGGLTSQQTAPVQPGAGCSGEGCLPPPAAAQPTRPEQGSVFFQAPQPAVVPRVALRRSSSAALRAAARDGRLAVAVTVNAKGRVSATLRGKIGKRTRTAGTATARASKAGTVRFTVVLSKAFRAQLRRDGRLKLTLTVRLSGAAKSSSSTLTIRTASKARGGAR